MVGMMNNKKNAAPSYILNGTVVHGHAIGRKIGMPTANLGNVTGEMPPIGVYMSSLRIEGIDRECYGITNVGTRPTVDDDASICIETNIFDFDEDIYDRRVELCIYEWLRPIQKFADFSKLMEQIEKDRAKTRAYFGC